MALPGEDGEPSHLADVWLALARINAKLDRLQQAVEKSVMFTAEALLRIEEALVELRRDLEHPGNRGC